MNKSKRAALFICIALPVIVFVLFSALSLSQPIVKTAIRKNRLPENEEYVICRWTQTTGYNWIISSSKGLGEKHTFCRINGPTPLDLDLKYDFLISSNKYVFYVTDVREYYSDELHEDVIEYTVSGWDILYPVRRESMITFLKTPKYILESDLNSYTGAVVN